MYYSHGRYLKTKSRGVLSSRDLAAELKKAGVTLVNDVSSVSNNSSSCDTSYRSSRSSGTARGSWTPDDSRKAVVRKRRLQRNTTESEELVEYRKEVQCKEARELDKRNKMMELRPWRDPPLVDAAVETQPVLITRSGSVVPNPQAKLDQTFQPLQYNIRGAFDEILFSRKRGADFASQSPRLPERAKSPATEVTSLSFTYSSLNPSRGPSFGKSSRNGRSASVSPSVRYIENDPRDISYPQRRGMSGWAASRTPRLSSPRRC